MAQMILMMSEQVKGMLASVCGGVLLRSGRKSEGAWWDTGGNGEPRCVLYIHKSLETPIATTRDEGGPQLSGWMGPLIPTNKRPGRMNNGQRSSIVPCSAPNSVMAANRLPCDVAVGSVTERNALGPANSRERAQAGQTKVRNKANYGMCKSTSFR